MDTMKEEWRSIARFHNLVEVSNLGGVRTLDRGYTTWRGGAAAVEGRTLTVRRHPWGYLWCEFTLRGKRYWEFVHRLVAEAFIGPCPPGQYVRHMDNNPSNNGIDNLRYGTPSDNSQDKWMHGTQPHGDQIWWRKVDSPEVIAMRDMRAAGAKLKDLADFYGISEAQVCRITTGKQWVATDGPVGSKRKPTRFLADQEKIDVLKDRKSGMTITQLSEKYGVSRTQVHNLVRKHED